MTAVAVGGQGAREALRECSRTIGGLEGHGGGFIRLVERSDGGLRTAINGDRQSPSRNLMPATSHRQSLDHSFYY